MSRKMDVKHLPHHLHPIKRECLTMTRPKIIMRNTFSTGGLIVLVTFFIFLVPVIIFADGPVYANGVVETGHVPGPSSFGGSTVEVLNPENALGVEDGQYAILRNNTDNHHACIVLSFGGTFDGTSTIRFIYNQQSMTRFFFAVSNDDSALCNSGSWVSLGEYFSGPVDVNYTGQFKRVRFLANSGTNVFGTMKIAELDAIKVTPEVFIPDLSPLPPAQTLSKSECPICGNGEKQNYIGDPINSYHGNFNHEVTDLSIPTLGQPLRFERAYNSLATVTDTVVYSKPLGYGWTHNYDINLTIATDTLTLKAPHGSRMRFADNGDGTYSAAPGVWATLTKSGVSTTTVYTVTAANQETFVFNDLGNLLTRSDPQKNTTVFSRTNGITLTRVTGPSGQRYLDFDYDSQGRLISVTDHANRSVEYGYDTLDNLTVMTDTRGLTWTYIYTGDHLLHEIIDPDGRTIEKTFYDAQGRAYLQLDGLGNTVAEIAYNLDNTRLVTESGKVFTNTYNSQGLWVSQENSLGQIEAYSFDGDFNRNSVTDANGNPTSYLRDAFGLTHAITDSLDNVTTFEYDSNNNLTKSVDANNHQTLYFYDGQNNLITVTNHLGDNTVYTYNTEGQTTSVTDENGNTTEYAYDSFGNRTVITDALNNVTTYEYDDLGRVITTTDP